MSVRIFSIIFFLIIIQEAHSQFQKTNTPVFLKSLTESNQGQGKVAIHQEEQLQELISRYIEFRKKDNKIPGYRIRIFSDSGTSARQHGTSDRDHFIGSFSDISAYLVYEQPNWKVYVGDFRTRVEAYKIYKKVQKDYPRAFLVFTRVNPK